MRWSAAVAVTLVVMALACGGGKEKDEAATTAPPPVPTTAPAPAPPPPPPPEPQKPPPLTFADAKFTCCDNPTAGGIVDSYLDAMSRIMAGSAGGGEYSAILGFAKKCQDVLPAEDKRTCTNLENLVNQMRKSKSAAEAKLPEFGMAVMDIAKRHKGSGKHTAAVGHCEKNDAYWLQRTEELKNPFGVDNADCAFIKLE
jgi:hypothetical protein